MTDKIPFYKERSIKGYMADAWKIIALNWRPYLRTIFPYLLLAGIANAIFFEIVLQYACKQALPAYLLFASDGDAKIAQWMAVPNIGNSIYLTLSFIVFIFGDLCLTAKLFTTIRHYAATNRMDDNTKHSITLTKDDHKSIKRTFAAAIIFIASTIILSTPFIILGFKWSLWSLSIIPFIILYASITYNLFTLQYALFFNKWKQAIQYTFKHALGHPLILIILTGIPVAFIIIACLMPQVTYAMSCIAANKSTLMGDKCVWPFLLPLVFFIINTISFSLAALAKSYTTWCLALKTAQKSASK